MRISIILLVISVGSAAAVPPELGRVAPAKTARAWPENVLAERLAGDTIATALPVPQLPWTTTGTTTGFTNDYDVVCPYSGSTSPDVVYAFVPPTAMTLAIDMCGSQYDTKIYVYDAALDVVACNDDFYYDVDCGMYTSRIEVLRVTGGQPYYLVVDGYWGEHGPYALAFEVLPEPCVLEEPDLAMVEYEPPLENGYYDVYNGGCDTPTAEPVLEGIFPNHWYVDEEWLWGVSGWYLYYGMNYRDTDWFEINVAPGGCTVTLTAERPTELRQLSPLDCDEVAVVQSVTSDTCGSASLFIPYTPMAKAWLWVAPTSFEAPVDLIGNSYHYLLHADGIDYWPTLYLQPAADRAPGCPLLPTYSVSAGGYISGFQNDADSSLPCLQYPVPGPDAVVELYLEAGTHYTAVINPPWYPRGRTSTLFGDTLSCYLVALLS